MKKQIIIVSACCAALPVSTYFMSNLSSGVLGSIIVIALSIIWGYKIGLIGALWSSVVAFSKYTTELKNSDIFALIAIYFIIAIGINFALRTLRLQSENLKEKKQQIEKAKESLEIKDRAVETSMLPMLITDIKGQIISINNSLGELVGNEIFSIHPLNINMFFENDLNTKEILSKIMKYGYIEGVYQIKKYNKSMIDVHIYGNKIESAEGECSGIMFTFINLSASTEDKQFKKVFMAVDQNPCMIIVTDANCNIQYVNPMFSDTTGYTLDEMMGRNSKMLRYRKINTENYNKLFRTISSGKIWRGELWNKKKNGEQYWAYASISPIFDNLGKIISYVSVFEDISKKKIMELELEERQQKDLYLINESKKSLGNLVIKLEKVLEYNNSHSNNSKISINNTLNNIINYIKIESEKQSIEKSEFDIRNLIENVIESNAHSAFLKKIELICCIKQNVPIKVVGNVEYLTKALSNIIDNAIKFTEKGEVTVFVEKTLTKDNNVNIKFFISDTGKGINTDLINDLFNESFENDDNNLKLSNLSLVNTRKMVESMGGAIGVKSKENEGSIFYMSIPFTACEDDYWNYFNKFSNKKLLLLMKNETSSLIVKELLETWGIEVFSFNNLDDYLSANENNISTKGFDLIILDDEIENIGSINENKFFNSNMENQIIAIVSKFTANNAYKEILKEVSTLEKPIKEYELYDLVSKVLSASKLSN